MHERRAHIARNIDGCLNDTLRFELVLVAAVDQDRILRQQIFPIRITSDEWIRYADEDTGRAGRPQSDDDDDDDLRWRRHRTRWLTL